jgi:hypothetical protein
VDAKLLQKILDAEEAIIKTTKGKRKRADEGVDAQASVRVGKKMASSNGASADAQSDTLPPEMWQLIWQPLVEGFETYIHQSMPLVDIVRLRTGPESYPEAVVQAIAAAGAYCLADSEDSDGNPETDAELALLNLHSGEVFPSVPDILQTGTLPPPAPQTALEWETFGKLCLDRSTTILRTSLMPASASSSALHDSSSLTDAVAMVHVALLNGAFIKDSRLAARFFRIAIALANELDPWLLEAGHDSEIARRVVFSLYVFERSGVFCGASNGSWFFQRDVSELALPRDYADLDSIPAVTLDMLETLDQIELYWDALSNFGVMCLLFSIRAKVTEMQSGILEGALQLQDPRTLELRTLLDFIEAKLLAMPKATPPRLMFLRPAHLLIICSALKIILCSPKTVREMITDDGSGAAWISSPNFLVAFEAASSVCDHLQPLVAIPGELDRIPVFLWPSLVKVALFLVAVIRKLRSPQGGERDASEDPALSAMLRDKLELQMATIEHMASCSSSLASLAQILRALTAPEAGSTEEQSRLEDEILALFPMSSEGSFVL